MTRRNAPVMLPVGDVPGLATLSVRARLGSLAGFRDGNGRGDDDAVQEVGNGETLPGFVLQVGEHGVAAGGLASGGRSS